jgi:hypothetical protein
MFGQIKEQTKRDFKIGGVCQNLDEENQRGFVNLDDEK